MMSRCKKVINVLIAVIVVILVAIPTTAFDFSTDTNFLRFTEGYNRYVTPIKEKEIVLSHSITNKKDTNQRINVVRNGSSLAQLNFLAKSADATLEFYKHSDGTSYMICTGKHDATGHTIVVMIEPKNRYAYVYDTNSYASEVVDLGEYVQSYNGRTLVPLRKFIGIFGGELKYYGKANFDIVWPSFHK